MPYLSAIRVCSPYAAIPNGPALFAVQEPYAVEERAIGLLVCRLFISPAHNYFGRHGLPAAAHVMAEMEALECVAGHGIRGDRFYDYRNDYKGQITFFALEVFEALQQELGLAEAQPSAMRRNVPVSGLELNQLIGRECCSTEKRCFESSRMASAHGDQHAEGLASRSDA